MFLKSVRIERFTHNVYTSSLNTWATSSPQKPLRIHYVINHRLQTTQHKEVTLKTTKPTHPLCKHKTQVRIPSDFAGFHTHQVWLSWTTQKHTPLLGKHHTTPRMLILISSRTHNTSWQYQYKNTIIKKERNRIHLGKSQDQRSKYKTQSYSTHLRWFKSSLKTWKLSLIDLSHLVNA